MESVRKCKVAILGSTGSIGRQALEVISRHRDRFQVSLLSANVNSALLAAQAREFSASDAVICDESRYGDLRDRLRGSVTVPHSGTDALCDLVAREDIGIVLAAMVGFSGLRPTIAAIKAGKRIALANKETLVAAGETIMDMLPRYGAGIIPVDSEHSAIFQCLQGNASVNRVVRIHLTASGGPFRTWSKEKIAASPACMALKHPNWNMGAKVTVDSATMMNKGLEMIEARWLFDVTPDKINVLVHPQSIIHSMVEFIDGAVIAQLGCPDMRQPIQYALSYPERLDLDNKKPDFPLIGHLDFEAPDRAKFPCLGLAFEAISRSGTAPAAMNAANEIAVQAYLDGRIGFYDIPEIISKTMAIGTFIAKPTVDDIFAVNSQARETASDLLK